MTRKPSPLTLVAAYEFARQSVRDSAMGDAGVLELADAWAAVLSAICIR